MWLAFLFGALTLAAQTLLLRRFLWHFEATDLGVGIFIATWLAWTGAGAGAARTRALRMVVDGLSRHAAAALPVLLLLAGVQYAALVRMRAWLGVPGFAAFPAARLALGCLLANAPFCLAAGLFFPAIGQRVAAAGRRVTGAFAAEAIGAAAAGAGMVALLAAGVSLDGGSAAAWRRMFAQGEPDGSFTTPAGMYVFGAAGGTFHVLGAGGIRDTLPERDRACEQAALLLGQRPEAPRALMLGRVPLAVCLAVAELQPGCRVVWCPDDPAYARSVIDLVRARDASGAANRVDVPGIAPRAYLSANRAAFALIAVAPPPPASAAGCGWWQPDFLMCVRGALRPDGMAAFALGLDGLSRHANANVLLENQVEAITGIWPENGRLVPGAGGWWLACGFSGGLLDAAQAAEGIGRLPTAVVPAAAVLELYNATRAADIAGGAAIPAAVDSPGAVPPRSDRSGAVRWLGLAGVLRREWPGAAGLDRWMLQRLDRGLAACVPVLLLLAGLWMLPVAAGRRATAGGRAVLAWLAVTGFLGLATLLGLMQTIELRFGSLYYLAGLASALYLAGLFAGNQIAATMRPGSRPLHLAVVTVSQLMLAGLAWRISLWPVPVSVMVAACGLSALPAGAAVAIAGRRLEGSAVAQGAGLLLADAWGSAVGGLLFAVFLAPCLGGGEALLLVACMTVGVTACALVPPERARFAAAVACLGCLLYGGLAWRAEWRAATGSLSEPAWTVGRQAPDLEPPIAVKATVTNRADESREASDAPDGRSRRIDPDRFRRKWATGELSRHPAEYWSPTQAAEQDAGLK